MPTYEFRCPAGHKFDHFFRKIGDSLPEMPCPTCGQVAVRQVSGGAGLLFKGSGFYITDYGKDGKKDQKSAAAAKTTEKTGDSGSAGESSPASESQSSSDNVKSEPAKAAEPDKSSSKKPSSPE
jgi:putative FmdB family regulatory protein